MQEPLEAPSTATLPLTAISQQSVSMFVFYHTWALRHGQKSLTDDMAMAVAVEISLILSCLDFANSLHYGKYNSNLNKLQWDQNSLAHIVLKHHPLDVFKWFVFRTSLGTHPSLYQY